jgi:hypothetical protein
MKKRIFEIMAVAGALVTMQSIAWEVSRMDPDYRFFVTPWALRGYDSIHGAVYLVTGALLLGSVLLVLSPPSAKARTSILFSVLMGVGMVVVAAVFGKKEASVPFNPAMVWLIAAIIGIIAARAIPARVLKRMKVPLPRAGAFFAATIICGLLITAITGGDTAHMPLWVLMIGIAVLTIASSITVSPIELAAPRMLVLSSVIAWTSIAVTAGALRTTLIRAQEIHAEYKDTQVTWGYFIANIGVALVFLGAVAMWAKRRDKALAAQRARSQREAAMKSAAEIEAAMESTATR